MQKQGLSISAVERETGISKENLRIWERRYGFPIPHRDEGGDRVYRPHQVEQLRLIKNLIDSGCKPSQVVGLSLSELNHIMQTRLGRGSEKWSGDETTLIKHIRELNTQKINEYLRMRLEYYGLAKFASDFCGRILILIGEAWAAGEVSVSEEHYFSEQFQTFLRQQIPSIEDNEKSKSKAPIRPRVLLATPPHELHALGLLLVEILLRLEGADVISYGAQVPLLELVQSATKHRVDIVGISLSACTQLSKARETVREIRQHLPKDKDLWVGGATGVRLDGEIAKTLVVKSLADLPVHLQEWRTKHNQG